MLSTSQLLDTYKPSIDSHIEGFPADYWLLSLSYDSLALLVDRAVTCGFSADDIHRMLTSKTTDIEDETAEALNVVVCKNGPRTTIEPQKEGIL